MLVSDKGSQWSDLGLIKKIWKTRRCASCKNMNHSPTDNFKSRDASASKNRKKNLHRSLTTWALLIMLTAEHHAHGDLNHPTQSSINLVEANKTLIVWNFFCKRRVRPQNSEMGKSASHVPKPTLKKTVIKFLVPVFVIMRRCCLYLEVAWSCWSQGAL